MLVTKQLMVAIDLHSMEKNIIEVNGYRQLKFFKISLFCVKRKKETHTGLEQVEGE